MTFLELALLASAVLLALAALPVLYRLIVGPSILDRAVASDMFSVLLVLALGLFVALTRSGDAVPAMLVVTAFAFLGSVAVARFVVREDQGLEPPQAEGQRTEGPIGDGARPGPAEPGEERR